jgi:hypothetical protein
VGAQFEAGPSRILRATSAAERRLQYIHGKGKTLQDERTHEDAGENAPPDSMRNPRHDSTQPSPCLAKLGGRLFRSNFSLRY